MPQLSLIELAEQANPGLWLETRTKIKLPNGKLATPRMNVLQRRINAYHNACKRKRQAIRGIGLKPRKRGFSTAVGCLHYTELQKRPIEGVIIGNKLETSDTVFRMMKVFAENDEHAKRGLWGSIPRFGSQEAKYTHGSLLQQSTALGGGSIRGQTPQFIHGTEVAHWEDQATTLLALLNAVPDDPESSIWLESTPNGTGDEFEKTFMGARWPSADECPDGVEYWRYFEQECPDQPDDAAGEFNFVRIFAAWFEFDTAFIRLTDDQKRKIRETIDSKSWYAGERELLERFGNTSEAGVQRLGIEVETCDVWEQLAWRRMIIHTKCGDDPKKFDQEYPRDPVSCFLASGNKFFDTDSIAHFQQRCRDTHWEYGQIDLAAGQRAVWRDTDAELSIFKRCEHPRVGCAYLISVDSAEGEDQTNGDDPDRHSVLLHRRAYRDANGVNWPQRVVARIKAPSRVPLEVLAELIDLLSRLYGRCPAIIEMNNTGLAVLKLCQALNVPLWKRIDVNPRSGKKEEKFGWRTTDNADYGGLRSLILASLRKLISGMPNLEDGTDYLIDIGDENAVYELSMFGEKDGKLQGLNAHDDDVLSLAIGSYNIDAATAYEELVIRRVIPPELRSLYADHDADAGLAMRS